MLRRLRRGLFGAPAQFILWPLLVIQVLLAAWVNQPWTTGDSPTYLALAESLRGGSYGEDVLRPPGLPIVLALWPLGIPALMILHGAIYLFCLYLVEKMGGRTVLWLALIYPFPALYVTSISTEAWAVLSVTLAAWFVRKDDWKSYALAGLAAGVGAMFRSDLLLLPVALGVYILTRNWRVAWVPIAAAGLAVTPYSLWNMSHFGRLSPVPLAGALGNSLYIASWQPHLHRDDLNTFYQKRSTAAADEAGLTTEVRRFNRAIGAPDLTAPWNPAGYATAEQQVASTKLARHVALERIKADPGAYASHVVGNLFWLWNTSAYPPMPGFIKWGLQVVSILIWLLALAGVGLALRNRKLWGPLVVLLYVPAIHLWLHTEARYTAPVRPLMLMFAAIAVSQNRRALIDGRFRSQSARGLGAGRVAR